MEKFKPIRQEKTIISIRMGIDLLDCVDKASLASNISRNEFIVQCIEYALNNMESLPDEVECIN